MLLKVTACCFIRVDIKMADIPVHSIVSVSANMRPAGLPFGNAVIGSLLMASDNLKVAANSPVVLKSPPSAALGALKNSQGSEKGGKGGGAHIQLLPCFVHPSRANVHLLFEGAIWITRSYTVCYATCHVCWRWSGRQNLSTVTRCQPASSRIDGRWFR